MQRFAIRSAHPGKPFFQVATLDILVNGVADYWPLVTIALLVPFLVLLLKVIKVPMHYLEER